MKWSRRSSRQAPVRTQVVARRNSTRLENGAAIRRVGSVGRCVADEVGSSARGALQPRRFFHGSPLGDTCPRPDERGRRPLLAGPGACSRKGNYREACTKLQQSRRARRPSRAGASTSGYCWEQLGRFEARWSQRGANLSQKTGDASEQPSRRNGCRAVLPKVMKLVVKITDPSTTRPRNQAERGSS